jgi:hypothetical protein
VAGFLGKKDRSIIPGQYHLKQLGDGPQHCQTAIVDFLETFEICMPLDNVHNAKWIWRQSVDIVLKQYVSDVLGGEEEGKARQRAPCDGSSRACRQKSER